MNTFSPVQLWVVFSCHAAKNMPSVFIRLRCRGSSFSKRELNIDGGLVCFSVQVNFVACQLFALLMAVGFRIYLHPTKTSPFVRHVVATLLGLYLALFCFGW